MSPTTITPLGTFRNQTPYPFCPGCGHGPILDRLNEALGRLELDPRQVVLVSDIGCSGLSDQYFLTSAFHGLHGRSVTYASGIKLARPELTVIVLMGDGGTGIGGHHLISAARRNLGITVLVFNNFNFGMTGGQHSATTPLGAVTVTTPMGNLERPLDVCATVAANGAAYVCRATSFDGDLAERIADGIRRPGFALLDVWELCTAYFLPANRWSKKSLHETLDELGFAIGVIRDQPAPELAAAYRELAAATREAPAPATEAIEPRFEARLDRRVSVVVAGSAGEKIGSAVRLAARAAVLSGLWAAERSDYPVTVKSGYSLSELVLGPGPIEYAGVDRPDVLGLLSADGARRARPLLERMTEESRVFALPGLGALETRAAVEELAPASAGIGKTSTALAFVAALFNRLAYFPDEALAAAADDLPGPYREPGRRAVAAGLRAGRAPR